MIELVDTLPAIDVAPAEYKRLLGFPRDHVFTDRPRELADWARAWYAEHGRPWVYARQAETLEVSLGSVRIDGVSFASKPLRERFEKAKADSAIVAAFGAGPELEAESQRLWQAEKPDEYFFLEVYGSAVVEHLAMTTGARLCSWAEARGLAVLPHYSPGYPDWSIIEQPRLLNLIRRTKEQPVPSALEVLESGMLRPKKSLLAVYGLTRHSEHVRRLTELVPCQNCTLPACQYRRTSFASTVQPSEVAVSVGTPAPQTEPQEMTTPVEAVSPPAAPLNHAATYEVSGKALRRWVTERLKLTANADGTFDAVFRYEGTTCRSMGRPILFDYFVTLGPREQGYPIQKQLCTPAPGDDGHKFMCRYMSNAEHLMVAIDHEKPLLGQPLNDVVGWERVKASAGCYCEPNSRKHKWGLVLETIHYAMVQLEKAGENSSSISPAAATPFA